MQQALSALRRDAEAGAEATGERPVGRADRRLRPPFPDRPRIDAARRERREVGQIEFVFVNQMEVGDVRCGVLAATQMHEFDEGDRRIVGVGAVGEGDPAPRRAGAQVRGDQTVGVGARLPPPRATDVRDEVASRVRGLLRGRIEPQLIARDEHSRDGIDERGLAGAGIAGDQETLAGHGKIVMAVQGPPVDDLNARETALTGMDHGVSSSRMRRNSTSTRATCSASNSCRNTGETSIRSSVDVFVSSEYLSSFFHDALTRFA